MTWSTERYADDFFADKRTLDSFDAPRLLSALSSASNPQLVAVDTFDHFGCGLVGEPKLLAQIPPQ